MIVILNGVKNLTRFRALRCFASLNMTRQEAFGTASSFLPSPRGGRKVGSAQYSKVKMMHFPTAIFLDFSCKNLYFVRMNLAKDQCLSL
jgi:hypothetical protein